MQEDKILQKVIEIEEEVAQIKLRIETFPTRDEFNSKMDKALGILERLDNERLVMVERVHKVEEDLNRVKQHLHIS